MKSVSKVALFLCLIVAGYGCSKGSSDASNQDQQQQQQPARQISAAPPDAGSAGCDASLWNHVYHPSRLQVLDQCKVVTGTIEEVGLDDDGDAHMNLKLDAGQDNLINKRNVKKKNGDLVIEVVCAGTPTLRAAIKSCQGYKTPIGLPRSGARVKVSGSYVIDTHNGWAELHPVSRIEAVK